MKEEKIESTEFLSVKEAAKLLHLSEGRIYKFVSKKRVPFYRPFEGERIAFKKSELLDWNAERIARYNVNFSSLSEPDLIKGIKNDRQDGKLRWELLPLKEIEDIVRVYTAGAEKYGPNLWQNLDDGYNRYKAALFRHLVEYEKGNEVDEETGCLHLAQVAWNAIAMLYYSKQKVEKK